MLHFYIDVKDKSHCQRIKNTWNWKIRNMSWKEKTEQCSYLFFFTYNVDAWWNAVFLRTDPLQTKKVRKVPPGLPSSVSTTFFTYSDKIGLNCILFTCHTYKLLNFSTRRAVCWTWAARLGNWEWFCRTKYTFDVEFLDFIAVICSSLICSYPLVPVIWIPLLGRELGQELSKKISCTGLLMFN